MVKTMLAQLALVLFYLLTVISKPTDLESFKGHITILVQNLTASLKFYQDMGFVLSEHKTFFDIGFKGVWINYPSSSRNDGFPMQLHIVQKQHHFMSNFFQLGQNAKTQIEEGFQGKQHIGIEVNDGIDKYINYCRKNRIQIALSSPRPKDTAFQLFIKDPDENTFEVFWKPPTANKVNDVKKEVEMKLAKIKEAFLTYELYKTHTLPSWDAEKNYKETLPARTRAISKVYHAAASFGHPIASRIAMDVMNAGGSAADGMIAGNAAMAVLEPMNCGLGGDLFALISKLKSASEESSKSAEDDDVEVLNASGYAAQQATAERLNGLIDKTAYRKMYASQASNYAIPQRGVLSMLTIPAVAAGWCALHSKYGQLPWREIFQPAISLALQGFEMSLHLRKNWNHFLSIIRSYEQGLLPAEYLADFLSVFLPGSVGPLTGEHYRNSALARAFGMLAEGGCESFYNGTITDELIQYFENQREKHPEHELYGLFSRKDFSDYWKQFASDRKNSDTNSHYDFSSLFEKPIKTKVFNDEWEIFAPGGNSQAFSGLRILEILSTLQEIDTNFLVFPPRHHNHDHRNFKDYKSFVASMIMKHDHRNALLYAELAAKRIVYTFERSQHGGFSTKSDGKNVNIFQLYSKSHNPDLTIAIAQKILKDYSDNRTLHLEEFIPLYSKYTDKQNTNPPQNRQLKAFANQNLNNLNLNYSFLDQISSTSVKSSSAESTESIRKLQRVTPQFIEQFGEEGDTVGFVVKDHNGLIISALQSNGLPFGAGVVVPSLGFVFNNRGSRFTLQPDISASIDKLTFRHRNLLRPYQQPMHTLSPWIVKYRGDLKIALAMKGGDRQPYAMVQLVLNMYLFLKMQLYATVDAERMVSSARDSFHFNIRSDAHVHGSTNDDPFRNYNASRNDYYDEGFMNEAVYFQEAIDDPRWRHVEGNDITPTMPLTVESAAGHLDSNAIKKSASAEVFVEVESKLLGVLSPSSLPGIQLRGKDPVYSNAIDAIRNLIPARNESQQYLVPFTNDNFEDSGFGIVQAILFPTAVSKMMNQNFIILQEQTRLVDSNVNFAAFTDIRRKPGAAVIGSSDDFVVDLVMTCFFDSFSRQARYQYRFNSEVKVNDHNKNLASLDKSRPAKMIMPLDVENTYFHQNRELYHQNIYNYYYDQYTHLRDMKFHRIKIYCTEKDDLYKEIYAGQHVRGGDISRPVYTLPLQHSEFPYFEYVRSHGTSKLFDGFIMSPDESFIILEDKLKFALYMIKKQLTEFIPVTFLKYDDFINSIAMHDKVDLHSNTSVTLRQYQHLRTNKANSQPHQLQEIQRREIDRSLLEIINAKHFPVVVKLDGKGTNSRGVLLLKTYQEFVNNQHVQYARKREAASPFIIQRAVLSSKEYSYSFIAHHGQLLFQKDYCIEFGFQNDHSINMHNDQQKITRVIPCTSLPGWENIKNVTQFLVKDLQLNGFNCLQYKIPDTVEATSIHKSNTKIVPKIIEINPRICAGLSKQISVLEEMLFAWIYADNKIRYKRINVF